MSYVDGFVIPVPTNKRDAYIKMCREAASMFKEYGALRVVECWGEDVRDGKVTDFRRAVAAEGAESIVFSWIVWPDKATRDAANKKMIDDARMDMTDMPFDGKRMIMGGFTPMFDSAGELAK